MLDRNYLFGLSFTTANGSPLSASTIQNVNDYANKQRIAYQNALLKNLLAAQGLSSITGWASGQLSNSIFGDSEVGRNVGNIFSDTITAAGNTMADNVLKGQGFGMGVGINAGAAAAGAGAGVAANYIGKGINALGGDSMLSRGIGQGVSTGLGLVGGLAAQNLIKNGSVGKLFGQGAINPAGLGMSMVGAGLSAAFGPSKEYGGRYGNITKGMDTAYDLVQMGVGFVPGAGLVISGAMALNKGLSNIFGSTDGMTRQDAILGSAFMPAPVKWLNMAGAKTTDNFKNQSWQNTERTNSFMQNSFGDLGDKLAKAREEAGKTYGTFSRGAYGKAEKNLSFANQAWEKLLAMTDLNELLNIRSEYMTSINNLRYAQSIQGGFTPLSRKEGGQIVNISTSPNVGMRLLSAAALIDSKQVILSAGNGIKIKKAEEGVKLYTILKGDTLWDIAKRYTGSGSNYKLISKLNNIDNPNLIYVGATIKIPVKTLDKSSDKTQWTPSSAKPSEYILRPKEEKPKVPRYEFKLTSHSSILNPKRVLSELESKSKTTTDTSSSKLSWKPYEWKLPEPFVPKASKLNHKKPVSTNNNSTSKASVGEFFRNLYHKIPEDYRTPIDLLLSGNFLGLESYINTAYDRKVSNDYKGVEMKEINVQKAKETPKYRLSLPSTFDTAQANLLKRTGLLGTPISYMNVPYDINIKDYKWHYRQRGDMDPVQHTYGMLAPIFNNMVSKENVKYHSGIIFNPKTGLLSVEPDLKKVPDGWLVNVSHCVPLQVRGMKKDENGNLIMIHPEGEYKNNYTTIYDTVNGKRVSPNVFTDAYNPDPRTLGAKAGGHFIISADPKKGNRLTRLVHGSLQNLSDAIDRLKANAGVDYVTVYQLDGGSFSMGYIPQKAINLQNMQWTTIESSEFNKYQNQNPRGSSGFMPVERLPEIPDTTYITTHE